eukprot:TRINITY_DN31707_c0_g1_i1.p1 TRINITY_DN31707_c0_g1~~TRINITY_DN31707_c0_g1_i1.p1  ORF type:complete len:271 (+),score=43.27 TRINITY_DN31707_c0_g1_i1:74-886(+)
MPEGKRDDFDPEGVIGGSGPTAEQGLHSILAGDVESLRRLGLSEAIVDRLLDKIKLQLDAMSAFLSDEVDRLVRNSVRRKTTAKSHSSQPDAKLQRTEAPAASVLPMPRWTPCNHNSDPPSPPKPPTTLDDVHLPNGVHLDEPPSLRVCDPVESRPAEFAREASPDSNVSKISKSKTRLVKLGSFHQHMQQAAVSGFASMDSTANFGMKAQTQKRQLPQSVSGVWRRQAAVLGRQLREQMADEVAMAKSNMSFRGGLWWLRHAVGLLTSW